MKSRMWRGGIACLFLMAGEGSRLAGLTYLGGAGTDDCDAIAAAAAGVFLACHSDSRAFPSREAKGRGDFDVVVVKLTATLSATAFGARFGGSAWDAAFGIAANRAGEAYVVGITESADFPTTRGAFQQRFGGGGQDAFVVKLDANGSVLFATLLGGRGNDFALGVSVDRAGNAYVVGGTDSPDFPTTAAARQRTAAGGGDAFVTKVGPDGTVLFSTYLGGSGHETAHGVAAVADGVYVAGGTDSTDFPTAGAWQAKAGGSGDAFLARLDAEGTCLVHSTYLGGRGHETARGVASDGAGDAYLAGVTTSPDFPVTRDALQRVPGGGEDAFVTRIDGAGSTLVYSTYLGGTAGDAAYALAVAPGGSAVLAGWTDSRDLPIAPAGHDRSRDARDGLVARLDPMGRSLLYGAYLGGSRLDLLEGVAVDTLGLIYVTGLTASRDLPTVRPIQASFQGGPAEVPYDALVALIAP